MSFGLLLLYSYSCCILYFDGFFLHDFKNSILTVNYKLLSNIVFVHLFNNFLPWFQSCLIIRSSPKISFILYLIYISLPSSILILNWKLKFKFKIYLSEACSQVISSEAEIFVVCFKDILRLKMAFFPFLTSYVNDMLVGREHLDHGPFFRTLYVLLFDFHMGTDHLEGSFLPLVN